jgi:threonine dehydrogenase-like Zn-dependent dehydrogenase
VFGRKLPLREMISHRFPLERIAEALELAAHPTEDTLKVVIAHQ